MGELVSDCRHAFNGTTRSKVDTSRKSRELGCNMRQFQVKSIRDDFPEPRNEWKLKQPSISRQHLST